MNGLTFNTRFDEQIGSDFDGNQNIDNKNSNESEVQSNLKTDLKNKLLLTLCCVSSEDVLKTFDKTLKDEETVIRRLDVIKETPFWRSINNSFAIVVIAFASFIWGFYA